GKERVHPESSGHQPEPGQSVWPIGVAVGVACVLVGLVISWWVVAIGGGITLVFGFLWLSDLSGHPVVRRPAGAPPPAEPGPPPPARHYEAATTTRTGFLSFATLGLGGVIGALVSIPPIFLAIVPPFLKQSKKPVDL